MYFCCSVIENGEPLHITKLEIVDNTLRIAGHKKVYILHIDGVEQVETAIMSNEWSGDTLNIDRFMTIHKLEVLFLDVRLCRITKIDGSRVIAYANIIDGVVYVDGLTFDLPWDIEIKNIKTLEVRYKDSKCVIQNPLLQKKEYDVVLY